MSANAEVKGYDDLAALMGAEDEMLIFRAFEKLNAKNLLYLQAELAHMERELQDMEQTDRATGGPLRTVYSKSLFDLKQSLHRPNDGGQWRKMLEVRDMLDKYDRTVLQQAKLARLQKPTPSDLQTFIGWMERKEINFRTSPEQQQWRSNEEDLITLKSSQAQEDPLTGWLSSEVTSWYHKRFSRENDPWHDEKLQIWRYRKRTLRRVAMVIGIIFAAILPASAMIGFYFVQSVPIRLLMAFIYNVIFSIAMLLTSTAKVAEIFAASSAFAAVQVALVVQGENIMAMYLATDSESTFIRLPRYRLIPPRTQTMTSWPRPAQPRSIAAGNTRHRKANAKHRRLSSPCLHLFFLPPVSLSALCRQSTDNAVMVKAARSYQCHRCSRSFARLEHLQRHDRSHTKEKPFVCDKCPKSFTRKDLLARHERLSHSSPTDGGQGVTPSSASRPIFDGLNVLASAVAGSQVPTPAAESPQLPPAKTTFGSELSGVIPAVSNQTPATAQSGTTTFSEPFGGFGVSAPYDGDDFTSFLDSIPLPSHPYSPTYQPLPLFPAFQFDSTPVYEQSSERDKDAASVATPSSSVLPRHGTQLPSLQPEESHIPYKARQPFISVTSQCRERIVALLADYFNVMPNPFIPSRHALSRCLTGYLAGYHDHYPIKHIPTLNVEELSLHLFLSMAALGAQYCREPDTSMGLYLVAKAVTMEHIRREFQWAVPKPPSNSAISEDQDYLETIQALLMLTSISSWSEREPSYSEGLYIRGVMETLLRQGGLNDLPDHDETWHSWIRMEERKRTKLVVFCFLNIHTIVFDVPPLVLTEEITLDLPCTEKEWQASTAYLWMEERGQAKTETRFQDALFSLFTHDRGSKDRLESFSSMGGYVLIHAIIQNIWLIQKANRLPGTKTSSLSPAQITTQEQALEHWCQCWEHNQESSIDPFNPHGPLSFTSTALLRLAYIRLNADFSSARRFQTWNPDEIARSLKTNLSVERSDRLTRAALHCAHALSTPIKLGINFVAHTQVVSWSNQYALCSLECAVLLAKWLEVATVPSPQPSLTEQETKLLEFVIEMVMEARHGVSRDWLLANNTRLSAVVTRLWARLFTADYIWELVNLIGRSLNRYADILESLA